MSLNGNLEDLPLLDIIQIVSFSKKTGYLAIRAEGGGGAIAFRDGLAVASFTWEDAPLDRRFAAIPKEQRAAVIKTRIEIALETLVRLREGKFSFSLTEELPRVIAGRDITLETLEVGINPQELLLDLARGIDEDRRDSAAAVEATFQAIEDPLPPREFTTVPLPVLKLGRDATAEPAAPVPLPGPEPKAPAPSVQKRTLLLADDEADVREVLAGVFREAGYDVVTAEDPEVAVKKGSQLGKDGLPFILVTDLGMPSSGGSSFHGGFEVVKRLWKMNLHPPVLMMTESLNPSLQLRARQMGISSYVFKPGLSKLNPKHFEVDLLTFAQRLVAQTLPGLESEARSLRATRPRPASMSSPPAQSVVAAPLEGDELSRQFTLLQRRLADLRRPTEAREISMLVMRVAQEFFERSILFLVKQEELRGLGGFGRGPKGVSVNLLARELVIPLRDASAFKSVVSEARPFEGPLPDDRWSARLMGKIGRFQSSGVALLPLVTHRETIAVLFGDNPETGRKLGRLDAIEVFVIQAGVAFENAFLQRKIQNLQGQVG